jgi:hypothetical protein
MWEGLTKKWGKKIKNSSPSAKVGTRGFPECQGQGTRGRGPFPECWEPALGEEVTFPEC